MNAFDAQAIGYAYAENSDFVISGINCDWQSDIIDISAENNISITLDVRCDQPTRINSNDSLCVYFAIDGGERKLFKKWVDDFEAQTIDTTGVMGSQLQIFIEGRSDRNRAVFIIEDVRVVIADMKVNEISR